MKISALCAAVAALVSACATDKGGTHYVDDASAYRADSGTFSRPQQSLGRPTYPEMHELISTGITDPGSSAATSNRSGEE
jgi:hypothetical protein